MNNDLKKAHLDTIHNDRAIGVYELLCAACEARDGGMTDADQMLIGDYARAEELKCIYLEDIAKRGLGQERSNGRQKYWQENKSPAQLRSTIEQQRKLLNELKLTPVSRKANTATYQGDDFDAF